jgi:hypothetical protein
MDGQDAGDFFVFKTFTLISDAIKESAVVQITFFWYN